MITRRHRTTKTILFILLAAAPLLAQQGITQSGLQQITDISAAKRNLRPAQQKMDSNLVFGVLAAANDQSVASFRNAIAPLGATDLVGNPVTPAPDAGLSQTIKVEISGDVNPDLLSAIALANGTVLEQSAQWGLMTAVLPLGSLETIAARSDVKNIQAPSGAHTNAGSITSQGYISHAANEVVSGLEITGAGVTVGVLSDSASAARIAALIASGDLPANTTVLPGQAGSGSDEGAAMMEIVHDIAPGANLIFATADPSVATFTNNII